MNVIEARGLTKVSDGRAVVRELSQDHRDLEEYFVELMEGGAQYV